MRIYRAVTNSILPICWLTLLIFQSLNISEVTGQTARRVQQRKLVKIYFYHDPGEYMDLAPVKRYVRAASPARAAIEALLGGPDTAERARGFDGLASASEFAIGSLKIAGGTARINFVVSKIWAGFPGDTAPIRFKSAVELTLKQFPNVKRVVVTLNGDRNFAED
jgi:spore germination protein GerM